MAADALHRPRLTREEAFGLIVALAAHGGLVAWLWLEPLGKDIQPPPERMTVSFAEEVAPEATSPEPMAQAAPDIAPEIGEASAAEPEVVTPPPEPAPKVVATPQPRPSRPVARPSAKPSAKATPKPSPSATPRRRPGGSQLGDDFLKGVGGETRGTAQNPPAARAGPQVAASLSQAIARQLIPHWKAPQGAEAEKLVTYLSWDLNQDGSLAGLPRVVRQEGITDANRTQAARHAEQAIRAVQLAAPFDLPVQYYSIWRKIRNSPFDRNLMQ